MAQEDPKRSEQVGSVPGETPPVFADLATFLEWDSAFYERAKERFYDRALARMLNVLGAKAGDLVLDAGCGLGAHSLRACMAGCRVHAIDFSAPALDEARRRIHAAGFADRVTFGREDLTRLSLESESFSFVFSWGVIIHIPRIEDALDSLARVLKPGGRLALYITNGSAIQFKLESLRRRVLRRSSIALERGRLGDGYWYEDKHGRIWIWQLNVPEITRHLESRGLHRIHRSPGMLTEGGLRAGRIVRRLLIHLNRVWFWLRLPAGPAEGNLVVFEKPRR